MTTQELLAVYIKGITEYTKHGQIFKVSKRCQNNLHNINTMNYVCQSTESRSVQHA